MISSNNSLILLEIKCYWSLNKKCLLCFCFDYHYCATCPTRIRLKTLLGPPIETQSTSWAKSICFVLLIILIPLGPNFENCLKKFKKIKISNQWNFWKIIVTQPLTTYLRLLFLMCLNKFNILKNLIFS